MQTTRVIISILVWDTPEYAENLFRSLFGEHRIGTAPHAVFVLDQGSGVETQEVLNRYEPHVSLIRLNANVGFPKGHNLVFARASETFAFDYFCVVNSDIRFLQDDWLDAFVAALDGDPDAAIVGSFGAHIIDHGPRLGHGTRATPDEIRQGHFDSLSGSLCMVRAQAARELGLFDEVFTPGYFEDVDMNLRFKEAGYRQVYCPLEYEHHYLGEGTSTAKRKRRELSERYGPFQERNRSVFLQRWQAKGFMRSPDYQAYRAGHPVRPAGAVATASPGGSDGPWSRCLGWMGRRAKGQSA